jgi:hypothetical protein
MIPRRSASGRMSFSPENVNIFVAGGAPGCAFSYSYSRIPPYNYMALMTRKITGATLTRAGK